MAAVHPSAVAMLDQGRAALDELVDVAGQMLAEYAGDEGTVLMVVTAFAACQPQTATAAAFAAVRLAKEEVAAAQAAVLSDLIPLCADCPHPMNLHAMTTRPPRKHKACGVHDGAGKCPCTQYSPRPPAVS